MSRLDELLHVQSGVISRRQLVREIGLAPHDLRRMVRRRELARVHDGVFVSHTGPLTWIQRAWAGVLVAPPAALCDVSALRAGRRGLRGHDDAGPLHVAVDRRRRFVAPPGVVGHRLADLDRRTQWNFAPPRLRVEEAALDVASLARDDFGAVAVLADAVQSRMTTTDRLLVALAGRSRIPRRRLLAAVLDDIALGACSCLERAYLQRVERPHGLAPARRQVLASSRGRIYRDIEYVGRVVIELDGRLDHSAFRDRDADLDRDLDAAIDQRVTARLGWGQVVGRPCDTARRVHRLLVASGVTSRFRRCPSCA